jgi:hypothetical protein
MIDEGHIPIIVIIGLFVMVVYGIYEFETGRDSACESVCLQGGYHHGYHSNSFCMCHTHTLNGERHYEQSQAITRLDAIEHNLTVGEVFP